MKALLTLLTVILVFNLTAQSDFSIYKYRSLGPDRGGRVTAVAGSVAQDGLFFLGATGGGVWRTTDYGTTWKNVSDGVFETPSIGAIAIAQNDANIAYVGTGSDGMRSNVILGKGVYKTVDGGDTWKHVGLRNVGQIGEIALHPDNYNVVYVSAIGNPFRSNSERGVYKTINGGETWEKVLFISDEVGFYDVEMLPGNPEVLFATAWKVNRKPWTIVSGGDAKTEAGIYKSVDGGKNWRKIMDGLPSDLLGKIDIGVTPADSKIIYAMMEAPGDEGGMYKSVDQGESFQQVSSDKGIRTRPFYYTNVKVDPVNPDKLYVMATGYFRSEDGGKSWSRMRPPHGDNHDMWIHPKNPDLFIQSNDGGANVTFNGGVSWSTQFNQPTAEIYQVEVDDQYPYWVYGGQQDNYTTVAVPSLPPDGRQQDRTAYIINTGGCETGPAVPKPGNHTIVFSNCKGRFSVYDKTTGQETRYDVGAYFMYGHNPGELPYRFQRVSPIHVSPHNPDVVYHTSQFVHKTTNQGIDWETISPDLTAFESNKQVISGSPITRDITGEEFYSTIYAIRESPLKEGLIWVGANDGPVHVSQDGGANWEEVTPAKLPRGGRVDAVEPSPHDQMKAYVAVLRYQLGDERPYVYRTNNNGKDWTLLTTGTNGIPSDYPVRVIREDPVKEGLLYAGTEYGLFVSFDDGLNWQSFQQNLPVTPVTDIKIVKEDLVLSTMGRGFYVLDDLSSLRQWAGQKPSTHTLFAPRSNIRYRYPATGARTYPASVTYIDYYLQQDVTDPILLEFFDANGKKVNSFISSKKDEKVITEDMGLNIDQVLESSQLLTKKGFQRFTWDMRHAGAWDSRASRSYRGGPMAAAGTYFVKLTIGGQVMETTLELETDPRISARGISDDIIARNVDFNLQVRDMLSTSRKLVGDLNKMLKSAKVSSKPALEDLNKELSTKEGTYEKPMLIDQIGYLYYMVSGSDNEVSIEARKRAEELAKLLKNASEKLEALKK
ncbi:MAG: WD40/YVTN/BNR-like repeat-containing protein [Cyclobacteriaceae bacterium]